MCASQVLIKESGYRRWRFDVASAGFLLVWSVVFERCSTSRLFGLTLAELRVLSVEEDFFVTCPKLALAFIVVKVGGGYTKGKNDLLLSGVLCMVLVETSFGYFFLERVYEADRAIHLAGSHLPGGMLAYMIPGETEADKRTVLNTRRTAACNALEARRRGATLESVGARRLDASDERAHGDAATLHGWAERSGIEYTLVGDLRDAFDALVMSLVASDERKSAQLLARVLLPTLGSHGEMLVRTRADGGDGATQVGGNEDDGYDTLTQVGDDLEATAIIGPRRCSRFR